MKKYFCFLLLLPALSLLAQQDSTQRTAPKKNKRPPKYYEVPDPTAWGKTITVEEIKDLVITLASDEMRGRETGQEGQRLAADYIAKQFKTSGMPPMADRNSFFQKILLVKESWTDIGIKVEDKEFRYRNDFYVYPSATTDVPLTQIKELVFVGYGIEDPLYSDYTKADVEGKAILIYDGEPLDKDGKSKLTAGSSRSVWSIDWRKKVKVAKQKGATLVFIVDPKITESIKNNRRQTSTGWKPSGSDPNKGVEDLVNTIFISPDMAAAIMGGKLEKATAAIEDISKGEKYKPIKIKNKIDIRLDKDVQTLEGSNVLGVIEGSDEKLKKEYVFVTAHYDHLGLHDSTTIYHGADDNASGTAAVIEIARAFQEAKKQGKGPKRTVVCMLVSGEEKGLLGSKYYVEFPMFPLDKTVVDINIDMIGRVDKAHETNPNYVYVIGSNRMSSELHNINEENNELYTNIELDYKYNAKDDPNHFYERSDHYNFAEKGIPAIFYFNGTHDDYHRATDTSDKINFEILTKRAQLGFYTAWEIANRPGRLIIDNKN